MLKLKLQYFVNILISCPCWKKETYLVGPAQCCHTGKNRPGCSLEGLMLKLKFQYFGHLMLKADSFEKTLILGKIEGRRRRGQQRMRWLDGITDSVDMGWVNSGSW